ncbi:MAG: aspartate aminotransferase [Deltaproteobacteria bacterium HGW-Deltaproteobacteria-19]|nr:MAG: aspartate aminotransferase [Deltaproteobacteria bacterium HGW-Deltaproteobacteria-19]
MKLSPRATLIKPSPTLAVTAKAAALKAAGRDIVGFGAGEPDFDTPEHIKQAAVEAIRAGFTKYTPVGGIDDLKDAIIAKLIRDNGLAYGRPEIMVSCGAKHSLYNVAQVLFGDGDEVIVPAPYWVSYPDLVVLAGGTPVILPTEEKDGFKVRPEALRKAVTAKTKALILNSPSNPTGSAYTEAELKALAEVVLATGILVITDDIYEKILYDERKFANIVSVDGRLKDQAIVVNGVSKAYAMTGWRIGYAAGPREVIKAATDLQSQNTSNPTSIAQKASVAALNGDPSVVDAMVVEFQKRRDVIAAGLNAVPGVSCRLPEGAFYVFPNVEGLFGRAWRGKTLGSSTDVTEFLLEEANVAVVPGIAFGDDRFIRLSYATSMKNIEEGLRRFAKAVASLG